MSRRFLFGKAVSAFIGISFLVLSVILFINTCYIPEEVFTLSPCSDVEKDFIELSNVRLERFRQGLRIPTVSWSKSNMSHIALIKLRDFIVQSFVNVHTSSKVQWEVVANYSLLYKIVGSDSSLKPVLLISHLDVVPTTEQNWTVDPFRAHVNDDGFIYARGTIDHKNGIFGILEALEHLLSESFDWRPQRTFYVAFGHDEELQGLEGAASIANILEQRERVTDFEFISDEGMMVVDSVIPGLDRTVAMIGVAEKGYATVKLDVKHDGGHSSLPSSHSAIGILAVAVNRLESQPQPSQFGNGVELEMIKQVAPHLPFFPRLILCNLWLFKPFIRSYSGLPLIVNSLVRTTTALTMFHAGVKSNVLPTEATAYINHRVHPSQSTAEVLAHDRAVVNDPRISIQLLDEQPSIPASPYGSSNYGFQVIRATVRQIFPEALVMPTLMIAATDSKHYLKISRNIYRFSPTHIHMRDVKRFHGIDERISLKNYQQTMNFYYHLIKNADSLRMTSAEHHKHDTL